MNGFKKCILVLLCLHAILLHAHQVNIKGCVKDQATGMPIEQAIVIIEKMNLQTLSDSAGTFILMNVPEGTYLIEVDKTGYASSHMKITVSDENNAALLISMNASTVKLQEFSISAERPISAASSSYISQSTFENRPKNSAQDLLKLVPGLFIAQHAGGGKAEQIFIRGFDCDHGTDIATFVDGMPVNMPSHGHGQGYADLHFLIPEVVEGMSVFKGTSHVQYGNFATGAAVNFKTYDSLPNNVLQLETGSVLRTKTLTSSRTLALLNVPVRSNKVSSYFGIDVLNNRGYFDYDQHFKRMSIFSKTTVQLNEYSKFQISVGGFGSSWNATGQIPERAVATHVISRYGSIDPFEGGTTQRNNLQFTYSAKLGAGEFETQAYACSYRFKLFSNFTFFLNDPVHGDMIEQDDNRNIKGLNVKYSLGHSLLGLNNKLSIGGSYRADEIENQLWHAPSRERMDVRAHGLIHERANAVYINELFRLSSRLRAELGLRYDYYTFDVEDMLASSSTHRNYSGFNDQSGLNPKLNVSYLVSEQCQLFLNSGSGYHSNDARSAVQQTAEHQLPRAMSNELGSLFKIKKAVVSVAFWRMDLSNELVYVGDEGTTENKGASRRLGVDASMRMPINKIFFVDADVNFSQGRFVEQLFGKVLQSDYYIPLAPSLTSVGGITAKLNKRLECSVRYRYMANRPANESNSIVAHGYTVADATVNYKTNRYKVGLVIENLLNAQWNEAQFATETRLRNESSAVDELHFTPGTPFYMKLMFSYLF